MAGLVSVDSEFMKILIYTHAFAPMIGGLETTVMTLAQGLGRRASADSLEVTLATPAPAGGWDDAAMPFRVVRQPGLPMLLRLFREADVIHLAGPVLVPMFLALCLRKPVVVEHDIYQAACPNGLLLDERTRTVCPNHYMAGRYMECVRCNAANVGMKKSLSMVLLAFPRRWLSARMTRNIYPSKHVGLRLALPRGVNIYHGTPEPPPATQAEPPKGISPACFAFIGRLVPEKGVSVLLRAGEILSQQGYEFRLKIIGDGPERASLEELANRCGLGGCTEFTGALRGEALGEALIECTASLMPSTWEDVAPLAAIEHLIHGRLLIASDIGGLGELVGDAGLKFPPGDAEGLAACLRRVLVEPGLAPTLRQKARERALQLFGEDRTVADHLALYHELAAPRLQPNAPLRAVQ
jgi:glycosyltransferase involved in cell wall biosynthesis